MHTSTLTLLHALHQGATVLTPNNRLSNQLLHDYFVAYGGPEKPRCLPYREFLRSCFAHVCHQTPSQTHPILLSPAQERYLWKQLLQQQETYAYHDGLLEEVQDAWTRCRNWQISPHEQAFAYTPQNRAFQHWQILFQSQLNDLNAITEAQLVDYLLAQPLQTWLIPKHIIWACFDDLTPQQQVLRQALVKGSTQESYDLPKISVIAYQYKAHNRDDEWLQMVSWAKERLTSGDQRMMIVIPDLQQIASTLQRFLKRHFSSSAYNISLGKTLIQYPLVSHGLEWLNLDHLSLTHTQAQLLLRSPYLYASQQEFLARAHFLDENTWLQEPQLAMNVFKSSCKETTPKLAHLLEQIQAYPQDATAFEWVQHFKQRLSGVGFPGEYGLDSAAYQCFQRFMTLFDEFIALGMMKKKLTAAEALNVLQDLAQQTVFQLKQPQTSLVITGLLEASGCHADSIWVCGLTDQCLPQAVRLSAFIPHALQRQLAMPHALAERELQLAKQLIERLQNGCQRIVFSYPSMAADQPNLPSPFITMYAPWQPIGPPSEPNHYALLSSPDNYQLPLLDQEPIKGGTTLLANQAKCPFKAFAAHRLHAKAVETRAEGLDARERGQITHRILEHLWQQLKSQENLCTLSPETLDEWIETIIGKTLQASLQKKALSYPAWLQAIEHERLKRLLYAVLDWEKQRPNFIVDEIEQTYTLTLSGLSFQIRIDRIDRVKAHDAEDFHEKWVIDYKTSLPPTKPWREERPESPQLLLYALTDTQITALIFAQLKSGQLTCQGFSEEPLAIEGIQTLKKDESWSDFQTTWHQTLSMLAEEFKQGYCAPSPQKSSTCVQCDFQNLCRIE